MTVDDPKQARRNRVFLLVFLAIFAISGVLTLLYGMTVVDRVKAQAARSDVALRLRAWSLLAHADATGRFPVAVVAADVHLDRMGFEDRLGALSSAEALGGFSLAGEGLPATRAEAILLVEPALAGADGDLPDAAAIDEIVVVSLDPEGTLPPVLSVAGRPSGRVDGGTTIQLVNAWLQRASQALAPGAEGP
ncbi:MAG: hypothetical protein VX012_01500 [Planctomycetota bacterium]|nr:hypothetical protein [Planctomycetota bacterium]